MRNLFCLVCLFACGGGPLWPGSARADDVAGLYYDITFNPQWTLQDNASLGDDPEIDEITTAEYELELDLEYSVNDRSYLFVNASLINATETVQPAGERGTVSGIELKQFGLSLGFGDEIRSELKIGRVLFVSTSQWWVWWDEELDAISLDSGYANVHGLLAFTQEPGYELITQDFIDPQLEKVQRILASLAWEVADDQLLTLYYLDRVDRSDGFSVGEIEEDDLVDESDADLAWIGISYLGGFEVDGVGDFFVDLHYSRVSGDETIYDFEDLQDGTAEVGGVDNRSVSGSALSYLLNWAPANLDDWSFYLGGAVGSGDPDPDDSNNRNFRQTGLQGDENAFGELYQPEISNMLVRTVGIQWKLSRGFDLLLAGYDYRQQYALDEVRESQIDVDPDGLDPDLGREIDLVLLIQAGGGLEMEFILAEFVAGEAYGDREGERSRYVSFELAYIF